MTRKCSQAFVSSSCTPKTTKATTTTTTTTTNCNGKSKQIKNLSVALSFFSGLLLVVFVVRPLRASASKRREKSAGKEKHSDAQKRKSQSEEAKEKEKQAL